MDSTTNLPPVSPVATSSTIAQPRFKSRKSKVLTIGLVFLALLFASIVAYIYLLKPYSAPEKIRVTNLTSRSATVSWVTEEPMAGFVVYSEKNNFLPWLLAKSGKKVAYDDRDYAVAMLAFAQKNPDVTAEDQEITITKFGEYYVHHVTIKNLDPEKQYYFMVGNGYRFDSGKGEFADATDGFSVAQENKFTTFKDIEDVPDPEPNYGSVYKSIGTKISDGVIYIRVSSAKDATALSAPVNAEGNWYLDLANTRTSTGEYPVDSISTDKGIEKALVESGINGTTGVIDNSMDQDAPWPDIFVPGEEFTSQASVSYLETSPLVGKAYATASNNCCENAAWKSANASDLANGVDCGSNEADWNAGYNACVAGECAPLCPAPAPENPCDNDTMCDAGENAGNCAGDCTLGGEDSDPEKRQEEHEDPPSGGPTCATHTCDSPYDCTENQTCGNCNGDTKPCACSCPISETDYSALGDIPNCDGSYSTPGEICKYTEVDEGGITIYYKGTVTAAGDTCPTCPAVTQTPTACTGEYATTCPSGSTCKDINDSNTLSGQTFGDLYNESSMTKCCSLSGSQFVCCKNGATDCFQNLMPTTCSGDFSTACPFGSTCVSGLPIGTDFNSNSMSKCCSNNIPNYCCKNGATDCFGTSSDEYADTCNINTMCVDADQLITLSFDADTMDKCTYPGGTRSYCCKDSTADCFGLHTCPDGQHYSAETASCVLDTVPPTTNQVCDDSSTWDPQFRPWGPCDEKLLGCSTSSNGKEYFCDAGNFGGRFWRMVVSEGETCNNPNSNYQLCLCLIGYRGKETETWIADGYTCESTNEDKIPLGKVADPNTICDEAGGCWCDTVNNNIAQNQYCPQNENNQHQGDYCSVSGTKYITCTCGDSSGLYCSNSCDNYCDFVLNGQAPVENPHKLISSVYAATEEEVPSENTQVVFFPETRAFSFISGGSYTVTIDGERYHFMVPEGTTDATQLTLFIDTNGNGVQDSGEETVDTNSYTISINKESDVFSYSLKQGINFVSFPFVFKDTENQMASTVLAYLNEQYNGNFYSISYYDSSAGRWVTKEQRGEDTYGSEDFQIIPGLGYIIKTKAAMMIELNGNAVAEAIPVTMNTGWNLIAIHGSETSYTAESLIDSIDLTETMDADNVTQFNAQQYGYEGLQKSLDTSSQMQVYGFDFPLYEKNAYFVRIVSGAGDWQPE